jgi:hypothetical protein
MFLTMVLALDSPLWESSVFLWLGTIAGIWLITITIGCLVMIPVAMWRLFGRLSRSKPAMVTAGGQVWDRWMDGPQPSRA